MHPTITDVCVQDGREPGQWSGASPSTIPWKRAPTAKWRAYDVVVAGVSLVTNYREEFNTVVRDQGVDALVKQLQVKNK